MPPELRTNHALLLQGPVGPFFSRFAADLRSRGTRVTKVNFNAGDGLFYRGADTISFRGRMDTWPATFRALVTERGIDAIFLFGDQRPIHDAAIRIAHELGIAVWVFEEGYLRPNFVTLERDGVNGNSRLPRDPAFYRQETAAMGPAPSPTSIGNAFYHHALWTAMHAVAKTFLFWRYPHYRHHRQINAFWQTYCWVRAGFRKVWNKVREGDIAVRVVRDHAGRYFFVPLQVYCDSQLSHSSYGSMEAFIDEVVATFAKHAPADHLLVVKHHPHDMPYRDYRRYLRALGRQHGCGDRLVYVHDVHLPTVLKHARGVITMNSTVGTSALHHHTPVKVMGRAIYDIPGMTSQGTLAEFLASPTPVDHELFDRFRLYLRHVNQINGSFYKRLPVFGTTSGIETSTFAQPGASGTPAPRAMASSLPELPRHDHVIP